MKALRILAMISCFIAASVANAAGAHIGILGGVTMENPKLSTTPDLGAGSTSYSSKLGFGGGLSFSAGAGGVGFEADALYLQHKFDQANPAVTGVTETGLQIPVMLRLHLLPMISLGIGGYYETFLGDVNSDSGSGSYDANNLKASDYGAVGSLRFALSALTLEARYTMGLADRLTDLGKAAALLAGATDASQKDSEIQILVGYRLGMGD